MWESLRSLLANIFGGNPPPSKASEPTPTPTPTPDPNLARYQKAFTDWGRGEAPPIASMSAELIEAGRGLPHPDLPAVLTLKETGGLRDSQTARELNNPVGIGPGIQYPDLKTSIVGGNGRQGLKGVLNSHYYDRYRMTGNLEDFIKAYTPPGNGNPSLQEQVATIKNLMLYFNQ